MLLGLQTSPGVLEPAAGMVHWGSLVWHHTPAMTELDSRCLSHYASWYGYNCPEHSVSAVVWGQDGYCAQCCRMLLFYTIYITNHKDRGWQFLANINPLDYNTLCCFYPFLFVTLNYCFVYDDPLMKYPQYLKDEVYCLCFLLCPYQGLSIPAGIDRSQHIIEDSTVSKCLDLTHY